MLTLCAKNNLSFFKCTKEIIYFSNNPIAAIIVVDDDVIIYPPPQLFLRQSLTLVAQPDLKPTAVLQSSMC